MSHDIAHARTKALEIHARLCAAYDCPIPYFHSLDPLSELVSSLLSHRTRNADSGRAFKALRARYPDWAAVRDAPTEEIEATIAGVTWPEQKAPRIQAVLRAIAARHGALSLDFLAEMPVAEARAWLESIPGIGPKTSAAVLSFSTLRKPALPVDSHHHRVAQRTGLIPLTMEVGPSHAALAALLPSDWDAQKLYDNHEVMMLHGQRCCFFAKPACQRCPILDLCPTGQGRMTARDAVPDCAQHGDDRRPQPYADARASRTGTTARWSNGATSKPVRGSRATRRLG
jgi:endonuclease III